MVQLAPPAYHRGPTGQDTHTSARTRNVRLDGPAGNRLPRTLAYPHQGPPPASCYPLPSEASPWRPPWPGRCYAPDRAYPIATPCIPPYRGEAGPGSGPTG